MCSKAFDGLGSTDWASLNQGVGAWIYVQFDKVIYISCVIFLKFVTSVTVEFLTKLRFAWQV